MNRYAKSWLAVLLCVAGAASAAELPRSYFRLMETGVAPLERRLAADPAAAWEAEDDRVENHYYPGALLVSAVLYAKRHPDNRHYRDSTMLSAALKCGDLLASESEKALYTKHADHHRDTYMWLEAYRLLEPELGENRRLRWRRELEKLISDLAASTAERQDRGAYNSPFLGTSPNHYALWASTIFLAGKVFAKAEWERLGSTVMHRFVSEEQSPDGYWGEHSNAGPTTAYDYLTSTGVALYWEHSRDPVALEALRRSTTFHEYFTYLDGSPVMIVDDRRRHAYVSPWGHFGFSNFADGRRYAEFLTGFLLERRPGFEHLGRIAQDALYFHEGATVPIPQDEQKYARQLSVPAGIRRAGPWLICLSGIISTQAVTSQYYLDRQSSLSVFHQNLGLIINGGNSKRQPELATFWEKLQDQIFHMPLTSRLRMDERGDRLSLAYNTFFSDLEIDPPSERQLSFRFLVTRKGNPQDARLTLQLGLKPGEMLETGSGRRVVLGVEKIVLGPEQLSGWMRHHGWTLKIDSSSQLTWPVYPYYPYSNGPEKTLEHAVGALSTPIRLNASSRTQTIAFTLEEGGAAAKLNPPRRRQ